MPSASSLFPISCLAAFGFLPMAANAQEPLKAETVDEAELKANAEQDLFERGKNLYDSAQASADLQTRRQLYLRSAKIFEVYLEEFNNHQHSEAAWWFLGSSYYQGGLFDDAKRCFNMLVRRYPQGKYAAAASYTLAADYYNKKEYALAAPLFERFANHSSKAGDRAKGFLFAGNCYRLRGQNQSAMNAYEKVIADPEGDLFRDQAKLSKALIYSKLEKYKEALAVYEDVAKSNTSSKFRGEASLRAAITATKLGKTELAERYLNSILNSKGMDEFRPDAQIALMENYYKKKQYKEVLAIYSKSDVKAEGEREAMRLMIAGRAMVKMDDPTRASQLFREVERLVKPENELAFQASYYRLNCFYKIEGRHVVEQINAFLELYETIYENDRRIHTARLMKAETLFADDEFARAAQVYSQIDSSLLAESNRAGFLYQRGWCYSAAGDYQGAIRSFSEFIKAYPKDDRIYPALVKRAKAYMESGEAGRAVADFDKLINDQKAPEDLTSLAWLESARTRRKQGNIKNMVVRYKGLLENVRDLTKNLKAEANYWIGWGLVKTNQPQDASEYLNQAREMRPDAYSKHAGLLLALSYFSAQDPKGLSDEIDIAIRQGYFSEIPDQAIQWAGMQSYNAGNYQNAAAFLSVVAKPDEPRTTPKEVWRYLAKARLETNSPAEALPAIANVLEVEDNTAWRADAMLDKGKAQFQLNRLDEARNSADEALALRPQGRTSAGLRILSGDLHEKAGNDGQAAADYLYVIQFHEDPELKPLAIHQYITILEKQNKEAEAAKYRTMLSSKFPDWKKPD